MINDKSVKLKDELMQAIITKNYKGVQEAINKGVDVNRLYDKHNTPLILAIKLGNKEIIDLLINNGANVNVPNSFLQTPLYIALKENKNEIAYNLIQNTSTVPNNSNINIKDSYGTSPLLLAVQNDDIEMVKFLVERGAEINVTDEVIGEIPIVSAARLNNMDILKYLIDQGADINLYNGEKDSALSVLVQNNNMEMVKFLVGIGVKINTFDNKNDTPLFLALLKRDFEMADYLIENGADVDFADGSLNTALLKLTRSKKDFDVIEYLLNKGADATIQNKEYDAPLFRLLEINSTKSKFIDLIKLIVKNASNINIRNIYGDTPLLKAIQTQQFEVVDILLNKSNIAIKNENGRTFLTYIVKYDYREIIKKVIKKHGINVRDDNNNTMLLLAYIYKRNDQIDYLIKHQAKSNIPNNLGIMAKYYDMVKKSETIKYEDVLRTMRFGIEIECCTRLSIDKVNDDNFPKLLDVEGYTPMHVNQEENYASARLTWNKTKDGSIRCPKESNIARNKGTEFISPAYFYGNSKFSLATLKGIFELKPNAAYELLKIDDSSNDYFEGLSLVAIQHKYLFQTPVQEYSYEVNDTCGLHVHLSNILCDCDEDNTRYYLENFIRLWCNIEDLIAQMVTNNRNYNEYCKPLTKDNTSVEDIVSSILNEPIKYRTLNLCYAKTKRNKYNTHVEVRVYQATTDLAEILNWVHFLTLLYSKCLFLSMTNEDTISRIIEQLYESRDYEKFTIVFDNLIENDILKKYYVNQIKKIHDIDYASLDTNNNAKSNSVIDIASIEKEKIYKKLYGIKGGDNKNVMIDKPDRIHYIKGNFYDITPFGSFKNTDKGVLIFADNIQKQYCKSENLDDLFMFLTQYGYIDPKYLMDVYRLDPERIENDFIEASKIQLLPSLIKIIMINNLVKDKPINISNQENDSGVPVQEDQIPIPLIVPVAQVKKPSFVIPDKMIDRSAAQIHGGRSSGSTCPLQGQGRFYARKKLL